MQLCLSFLLLSRTEKSHTSHKSGLQRTSSGSQTRYLLFSHTASPLYDVIQLLKVECCPSFKIHRLKPRLSLQFFSLKPFATCYVLVNVGSLGVPRSRFCLWILVAKALQGPVLGHHLILQNWCGSGLVWFWSRQGLDNTVPCIWSHIPHFKIVCQARDHRKMQHQQTNNCSHIKLWTNRS